MRRSKPTIAKDSLRVNHRIRVSQVMVIDDHGVQLGLKSIKDAIELAADSGLDLVEVAPQAKPPVCRFMDYGKFKYRKNKKAHEAKKNQKIVKLKEIKITPKTSEHDYLFKLKHVKRFLNDGNKAKVTVFFRGRQITHTEIGKTLLDKVIEDTKEFAVLGQPAKMEGRRMNIILEPRIKIKPEVVKSSDSQTEEQKENKEKGEDDAED